MTDTTTDDAGHIKLTGRQRERFDRIKAECTNEHLPEPADELMLKSLMDTWDAVDEGLYSDPPPGLFQRVRRFISRFVGTGKEQ